MLEIRVYVHELRFQIWQRYLRVSSEESHYAESIGVQWVGISHASGMSQTITWFWDVSNKIKIESRLAGSWYDWHLKPVGAVLKTEGSYVSIHQMPESAPPPMTMKNLCRNWEISSGDGELVLLLKVEMLFLQVFLLKLFCLTFCTRIRKWEECHSCAVLSHPSFFSFVPATWSFKQVFFLFRNK